MAYVWLNVAVANGRGYAEDDSDKTRAKLSTSERKLGRKLSSSALRSRQSVPNIATTNASTLVIPLFLAYVS